MTFIRGTSGNPAGRPKGSKDRRSIFRELVEPHKDKLMQKAVDMALSGNEQMLRLLLDRLLPVKPRDNLLPDIGDLSGNIAEQANTIISLTVNGTITPLESTNLMRLLTDKIEIVDVNELRERLDKFEQACKKTMR